MKTNLCWKSIFLWTIIWLAVWEFIRLRYTAHWCSDVRHEINALLIKWRNQIILGKRADPLMAYAWPATQSSNAVIQPKTDPEKLSLVHKISVSQNYKPHTQRCVKNSIFFYYARQGTLKRTLGQFSLQYWGLQKVISLIPQREPEIMYWILSRLPNVLFAWLTVKRRPGEHRTFMQRRISVNGTSWRCIDVGLGVMWPMGHRIHRWRYWQLCLLHKCSAMKLHGSNVNCRPHRGGWLGLCMNFIDWSAAV